MTLEPEFISILDTEDDEESDAAVDAAWAALRDSLDNLDEDPSELSELESLAEAGPQSFSMGRFNPDKHPRDKDGQFARGRGMRFDPTDLLPKAPRVDPDKLRAAIKSERYFDEGALGSMAKILGIGQKSLHLGTSHGHVNPDIATSMFQRIAELKRVHPELQAAIKFVTAMPTPFLDKDMVQQKPDTGWGFEFFAGADAIGRRLHLNPLLIPAQVNSKDLSKGYGDLWSLYGKKASILSPKAPEHVAATHEAAHFAQYKLMEGRGMNSDPLAWMQYFKRNPVENLEVSAYGRTHWAEAWAELFTAHKYIPRRSWSRELEDWYEVYEQTRPKPRRAADDPQPESDELKEFLADLGRVCRLPTEVPFILKDLDSSG